MYGIHRPPPPWLQLPFLVLVITIAANLIVITCAALPLSASGQWFVDDATGQRVKLACVNWPAHLHPMLAEGLDKQPVSAIASAVAGMGFNCVRLTYATAMFTNATLSTRTVSETFAKLGLTAAAVGIAANNPAYLPMDTVSALIAVAAELGRQGVMVILDNQISIPGWCCADDDGNGFWGDSHFDADDWLRGLRAAAAAARGNPYIVGMSLRNELRGKRQNADDWYKYMQMGADAIHGVNPDVLVIHSGLSYDQNLRFLKSRPLNESFGTKLVYEIHRYAFSNGDSYTKGDVNEKCGAVISQMENDAGYLTEPGQSYTAPLFVSEFGLNVKTWGSDARDVRFFACFSAFLAAGDLDWAVWALQGSYYFRQGTVDLDEQYGILNHNWDAPRNTSYLDRLQNLQPPLVSSATTAATSNALFHPATGLCVHAAADTSSLTLDSCTASPATWTFSDGRILLDGGGNLTVAAQSADMPAVLAPLSLDGAASDSATVWNTSVSATGMQYAATVNNDGTLLCLDGSSPPAVETRSCVCVAGSCSAADDPTWQWFKLVPVTIPGSR